MKTVTRHLLVLMLASTLLNAVDVKAARLSKMSTLARLAVVMKTAHTASLRRNLREKVTNYTNGPPAEVRPRFFGSCWQQAWENAENFIQEGPAHIKEGLGVCTHGNWCGSDCTNEDYSVPSIDALDETCKQHDICLRPDGPTASRDPSTCERCACDAKIRDAAQEIYLSIRTCSDSDWDCLFCSENELAEEASSVALAFDLLVSNNCESIDYDNCADTDQEPSGNSDDGSPTGTDDTGASSSDDGGSSTCPYEWYSGDILGMDLRHESAGSADQCCSICSQDSYCYAWTFDPSNGAEGCDGGGCCFLKESGTYEFGTNSELTSGVYTG